MTEEKIVHDLSKVKTIKVSPSMTHDELVEWLANGDIINGFIGGVLTTASMLDNKVTAAFPGNLQVQMEKYTVEEPVVTFDEETGEETTSTITVTKTRAVTETIDGEEVPVMEKMEWQDYTLAHVALDGETAVLAVGKRNKHKNRHSPVTNEELRAFVDKFGIENILTRSEYHDILKSEGFVKPNDGIV